MDNIRYALKNIVETEFKFDYDFDFSANKESNIGFLFRHKFIPEIKKNILTIEFEVKCQIIGQNIVHNIIRVSFNIDPLTAVIEEKGNSMIVKAPALVETLLNVTIGAMRGIFMKNLKGTPLDMVIIPLIPMDDIKKILNDKGA